MEPNREEIEALVEYHRTQQYEYARHEDYASAQYHKDRAQEWAHHDAQVLEIKR